MPIDDLIIETYVYVDDFLKEQNSLRERGPKPILTGSEVITIEIVREILGIGSDKAIFDYFKNHWHAWFPMLNIRQTFAKQSAYLWKVKELLRQSIVSHISPHNDLLLFKLVLGIVQQKI